MIRRISAAAVMLALGLSGCAVHNGEIKVPGLAKAALVKVGLREPEKVVDPNQAALAALTPESIAAAPRPLMIAQFQGKTELMEKVSLAAGKATWGGTARHTLILSSGFLASTRGMKDDLMGVDVSGFGAAMAAGGTYSRTMEWLDGLNQAKTRQFTCTITHQGDEQIEIATKAYQVRRIEDRCEGDNLTFVNRYWLDGRRFLRQAQQFVSVDTGYVTTVLLTR